MYLESNERQINDSQLLRIEIYSGYDFDQSPGYVNWFICDYSEVLGYDEVSGNPILDSEGNQAYTIFKTLNKYGVLWLTIDIVNQWGADDQIIFDYVIQNI